MRQLSFYCGDYQAALKYFNANNPNSHMEKLTQDLQTGDQMVEETRQYIGSFLDNTLITYGAFWNQETSPLYLFSNCEFVFNTLRLLVAEGKLDRNQVNILYFEDKDANSPHMGLMIGKNGQLNCWPYGFFDTMGKLLTRLMELR
jgi:hypothetical protein